MRDVLSRKLGELGGHLIAFFLKRGYPLLARRLFRRRLSGRLAQGFNGRRDLFGVLGDERDRLALPVQSVVLDAVRDVPELEGSNLRELRQLKIPGTELVAIT